MPAFFAPVVMLPQGWGHNVRITVNEQGTITHVEAGATSEEATLLPGVVIPSISNLHSHAFQRVMAGLTEVAGNPQDSFWTWRDVMYRMVQKLSPDKLALLPHACISTCSRAAIPRLQNFIICIMTLTENRMHLAI